MKRDYPTVDLDLPILGDSVTENQSIATRGSDVRFDGAMLVLAWYYRWHSLYVEEFDSIDAAASFLGYLSDTPEGAAIEGIEVWSDEGYRRIGSSEIYDIYDRIERERAEKERARRAVSPPPPVVAHLYIKGPDGSEAGHESFTDEAKAQAAIDRLAPALGDRLVVKRPSQPQ